MGVTIANESEASSQTNDCARFCVFIRSAANKYIIPLFFYKSSKNAVSIYL